MTAAKEHTSGPVQRGFVIRGIVQGVGFRYWTRRLAQEAGVAGTVCNCPDGSVEVRVRGAEHVLEAFAERLSAGPAAARVSSVESFPCTEALSDDFHVVRWS